jgi:hypothetical protein
MIKYKETNYYISENGEVLNQKKNRGLKQHLNNWGYYFTVLGRKTGHKFIHRLVAELYVPNPENKPEVNHIDGNKTNNHFLNLEWVTVKENIAHARKIGLNKGCPNNKFGGEGEECSHSVLTNSQVKEIREKNRPYQYTYDMLSKEYKVSYQTINRVLNRKTWKHI